jgi:hypothetical protein
MRPVEAGVKPAQAFRGCDQHKRIEMEFLILAAG